MNYQITIDDIIDFVKTETGEKNIKIDSDIFYDFGCVGDDFHELVDQYAGKFKVDMTDYLWYFHADEEGFGSFGGLFFKPPYKRVDRIPITPLLLLKFAKRGKWQINYPEHHLPKRRIDLSINAFFFVLIVVVLVVAFLIK